MNRKLLLAATAIILNTFAFSQCKLLTDSTIAGDRATEHSMFTYNGSDQLILVEYIDSNSVQVDYIDTIVYNGAGYPITITGFWTGSPTPYRTTTLTYNGSYQITKIAVAGDNGNGPWTMAHDITYDGNGNPTDVIVDPFSISGNPEGMLANWENIVWSGGNPVSLDLIGDLGGGIDTLELNITVDNKNNLARLMPITESFDAVWSFAANNYDLITFAQNEIFGSAGTVAIDMDYTYTANNEVLTSEEVSGVFMENMSTKTYTYDCSASVADFSGEELKLFPNPFNVSFSIDLGENGMSIINVYDLNGRLILNRASNDNKVNIDLSDIEQGVYIVEVNQNGVVMRSKIIKE